MVRSETKAAKHKSKSRTSSAAAATPLLLVRAASAEFARHGFVGTDTNRIARRAGFAPQTFYRWFDDKIDVFIQVYNAWVDEELKTIATLNAGSAPLRQLAKALVAHHKTHLRFRRDLRQLALENQAVRTARAESRRRQVEIIKHWHPATRLGREDVAVALFKIERLADAIAEGEFGDMKLGDAAAYLALDKLIKSLQTAEPAERHTPLRAIRRRSQDL
jgi:AcrR family transcriptional regulator